MGKCVSAEKIKEVSHSPEINLPSSPDTQDHDEYKCLKKVPKFTINDIAKDSILAALSVSRIFRNISKEGFEIIINYIKLYIAEEGTTIYSQGKLGILFYIINSGSVEVFIDRKKKYELNKGNCFGDMALISDSIRKETVRATCKTSLWVLSNSAFAKTLKSIFKKSYDKVRFFIKNAVFFKDLPDSQIDLISKVSVKTTFQDNDVIIREGDIPDMLYILIDGIVEFKKKATLSYVVNQPGDVFGEIGMLTYGERVLTSVARGTTEVISVNLLGIKSSLGDNYEILLLKNLAKNCIANDPYFVFIDLGKVAEICSSFKWNKYKENDLIFYKKKGKLMKFYVICIGSIWVPEEPESLIRNFQILGLRNSNEMNLRLGEYRTREDCIIGEIPLVKVNEILEIDTSEMFKQWDAMKLLRSFNFLHMLDLESIKELGKHIKKYNVLEETQVFSVEDRSSKVYFVRSGTFEVYDSTNNLVRIVKAFDVFGEKCFFENKRTASVVCVEEGEFYAVHKKNFMNLKEYKDLLIEAERRDYYHRRIDLLTCTVIQEYLSDPDRRRFGIKTDDHFKYELIIIPKSSLKSTQDCSKLIYERDLMIQVEHRQLIKVVRSKVDQNNIYFITEHINGSPLSSLLPIIEPIAKVLTLHFVNILDYLHRKNIIHRNFCTDNIIISSAGIPHLFNFRSAKIIENRTYSKVGSPFYRSPEMILSRGYSKSTDIWSLGVVLYEILYKKLPFSMKYDDSPFDAYEKIIHVKHGLFESCNALADNLLNEILCDSDNRIDLEGISNSEWLADVDKGIAKKRLTLCPNVFGKSIRNLKIDFIRIDASKVMNMVRCK